MNIASWKLALAAVALLTALGLYAHHRGVVAGEERMRTAAAIAATGAAKHAADSVTVWYRQQQVTDSIVAARHLRAVDDSLHRVVRATNAVLETSKTTVADARRVLADTAATLAALRVSLFSTTEALDSTIHAFQRERQSWTLTLTEHDTTHARLVARLTAGALTQHSADSTAYAKLKLEVAVRTARPGFVSRVMSGGCHILLPVAGGAGGAAIAATTPTAIRNAAIGAGVGALVGVLLCR